MAVNVLIRRQEAFQMYLLSRGKHRHLKKKGMTTIQKTVVPHSSGHYVGRGGPDSRESGPSRVISYM